MDTPGDKKDQERVTFQASQLHSQSESEPDLEFRLLAPAEVSSVLEHTSLAGTSDDMGVITHLPVAFSSASLPPLSNKPEIFQQQNLEQATLEDYYGQSKYYETLYPVGQQQGTATTSTFQNVNEPGPSGLQSTKSKPIQSQSLKKKKPDQKKNHVCPHCHKTFSTGEKLQRHFRSHQETKESLPFKCDQCKKTFTSKFKLVRHALIHSDKKPFSCSVCERTFHRKDHLKNHIKVHSPTKKLYECSSCKKQYTSLLSFRKHQAVHAAEEGNLTCQICSEVFDSKQEILYHLKVHAGSRTIKNPSEKKYHCDYCDRRFFTKKDVRRHLVVHTGMRDFLCQFCPQRFGRKDHLVRHIKKSHNKDYTEQGVTLGSESSGQTQHHLSQKPATVTSGALYQDDSTDDVFDEISPQSPRIKAEPEESDLKTELDLEGVKTIFEEENVSPLEEEDIYLSEQSTQSELKELLITDIFKKIEKPLPLVQCVPTSSEPRPSTTIRHLPQKSVQMIPLSSSLTRHRYPDPPIPVQREPERDVSRSPSTTRIVPELLPPPLVPTSPSSVALPVAYQQSISSRRKSSLDQILPSLVPFQDPALPLPPLVSRPVRSESQLPSRSLPESSLPLPPLIIRTRAMPRLQRPEQEQQEEKKPLPGFSQTFQPPPSS